MKVHLSLPIGNIKKTAEFYRTLFREEPSKEKVDYLKFEPKSLLLNISFYQTSKEKIDTNRHMGIQFTNKVEFEEYYKYLQQANKIEQERQTNVCCYANQDKFWIKDPDGYLWELYYLVEDTTEKSDAKNQCCNNG